MRMSTREAISYLLLNRPSLSTAEIDVMLAELGFVVPTTFLISQIKIQFLQPLKFLEQLGLIDPDLKSPFLVS